MAMKPGRATGVFRFALSFALSLVLALVLSSAILWSWGPSVAKAEEPAKKTLVYLVSDLRIPFWSVMWKGVRAEGERLGYSVSALSAENDAKREIENAVKAIGQGASGLIVSPTNSAACATILALAEASGVPVVISDIGTDSGTFVSFISSDNRGGAYALGQLLVEALRQRGWQDGRVGIIAIPQKRANGRDRTAGFTAALVEAGIKGAGIAQQVDFSHDETYRMATALIDKAPDLRAIWLQGSDRYRAALEAIRDTGKEGQILLITFDAEPEFLDLIPAGVLVGAGMQQPLLMGEKAVEAMDRHLRGEAVASVIQVPVLAVSSQNMNDNMKTIRRNVLGLGESGE